MATAEMALVSTLLFLALLPIYDFSRSWYVQSNLQHAARTAARFATTGRSVDGMTREQSVVSMVRELSGPGLESASVSVHATSVTGTPSSGAGRPGDLVTVTATADVPLLTPGLSQLFPGASFRARASATFLNEDFPQTDPEA